MVFQSASAVGWSEYRFWCCCHKRKAAVGAVFYLFRSMSAVVLVRTAVVCVGSFPGAVLGWKRHSYVIDFW